MANRISARGAGRAFSGPGVAQNFGANSNRFRNNFNNLNNSVSGSFGFNNGANGFGGRGYRGINSWGSNSFGLGYGGGGYGYGNRGYGYGNGRYVMAYVPGIGWVMVPLRAIRMY
jgi:hypothetical protein